MRIGVLAWGSLVWNRGELLLADDFRPNGPRLAIEFCRVSSDGRLTLVIDETFGTPCPTYSGVSSFEDLDKAIENLWVRESKPGAKIPADLRGQAMIGFVDLQDNTESAVARQRHPLAVDAIREWAGPEGFSAIVWTALPIRFKDTLNVPFSTEAAIAYLDSLEDEAARSMALDYVRKAPPEVRTPVRAEVQKRWPG
ncbi:hypothetical protein [Hyphomicrobium sp.]|uniref:hypothetical protein n=1 Tax=Hyphomicrobium sp. TaxID=82 RepID=UPI002E325C29|nr:hypothetical protein [Hyphomicrobium sp.]HEX2839935.1 hypothetical protein [Hyphomicrobium sp.]